MLGVTSLRDYFVAYNSFFLGNNLHLLLTAEAIVCLHA